MISTIIGSIIVMVLSAAFSLIAVVIYGEHLKDKEEAYGAGATKEDVALLYSKVQEVDNHLQIVHDTVRAVRRG